MNTSKYTTRTFIIILLTIFIGGMCQAQSVDPIEEFGISQEEYNEILKHADNQEMIPTTRILVKHEFLGKPNIIRTKEVLDSNCIVKPWTIPMLPNYYIKEEKTNENNK